MASCTPEDPAKRGVPSLGVPGDERPLSPGPRGVAAEGLCRLSLLTVLVEAGEGDSVSGGPSVSLSQMSALTEPMRISETGFEVCHDVFRLGS